MQLDYITNLAMKSESYSASLQIFQIDNQLYSTPHPLILTPVDRTSTWLSLTAIRNITGKSYIKKCCNNLV
jgi:hypothetical protein